MLSKYKSFADVQVGETLERPVLVAKAGEASTSANRAYVRFTLMDGHSSIKAQLFDTSIKNLDSAVIQEGAIVDVKISITDYKGGKAYKILSIDPTTNKSLKKDDFIKSPPVDRGVMYDEICDLIKSSGDDFGGKYKPLSDLALKILKENKDKYMKSSAALSIHHDYLGGMLYHTYRMVKTADAICGIYDLDRELMICGAALHDIGKIWEFDTSDFGDVQKTSDGRLLGHLYIGASLIKKYYSQDENYCFEKVKLLVHMILSHHGKKEWDAVSCPATKEAFALHFIDDLDTKLDICDKAYDELKPGEFTKAFPLEDGVYRPKYDKKPSAVDKPFEA